MTTAAPDGDLSTYHRSPFVSDGASKPVYRKGSGPAAIVITEMPGLSPQVFGFADRLVQAGCSVALPDLYGTAGRNPFSGATLADTIYAGGSMLRGCISRDFSTFALDRTSPIADWLRALARAEHERCGGPGVGVVGMCFSGGFALAMATDPAVVAPVMSQPSLPLPLFRKRRRSVDVSEADLDIVAGRCSAEGMRVMGLRFDGDPLVPAERFEYLRQRLGAAFLSVELDQADGNPDGLDSPLLTRHHSVLTLALNDEANQPTRQALDQVVRFLTSRLNRND